jgi:hypothetical protein
MLVPVLVAVTVAPGMEAPLTSLTVPEILAVTLANDFAPTSRAKIHGRTANQWRLLCRYIIASEANLHWREAVPRTGGQFLAWVLRPGEVVDDDETANRLLLVL